MSVYHAERASFLGLKTFLFCPSRCSYGDFIIMLVSVCRVLYTVLPHPACQCMLGCSSRGLPFWSVDAPSCLSMRRQAPRRHITASPPHSLHLRMLLLAISISNHLLLLHNRSESASNHLNHYTHQSVHVITKHCPYQGLPPKKGAKK